MLEAWGEIPSYSTRSEIFHENVYPVSEFSFIFGRFWSLVCEKCHHVSNVAKPKENDTVYYLVNFCWFEGNLLLDMN